MERKHVMPEALLFEFSGVTADRYRAVNAILGLEPASGDGASLRVKVS
jgi:hypothetical protein